jgi:GNAT superfamily N-acetyltransferase
MKLIKKIKWKKLIIWFAVFLVLIFASKYALSRFTASRAASKTTEASATTVKVETRDIQNVLSSSGAIEPLNTYDVKTLAEGEITASDFEVGDTVEKGQVLYQISTDDLDNQIDNADTKNYRIMVIENIEDEIVGFFNVYHGYPSEDCLWIGMFLIDRKYRHNEFGSKTITSIINIAKENGWLRFGLGVYLKNWTGLRFWINNGFKEIGGIFGDKQYSNNTFSLVSLFRNI